MKKLLYKIIRSILSLFKGRRGKEADVTQRGEPPKDNYPLF